MSEGRGGSTGQAPPLWTVTAVAAVAGVAGFGVVYWHMRAQRDAAAASDNGDSGVGRRSSWPWPSRTAFRHAAGAPLAGIATSPVPVQFSLLH